MRRLPSAGGGAHRATPTVIVLKTRRGRDRAALVHVAHEHRRAALDRGRRGRLAPVASRRRVLGGREHVRLEDPPAAARSRERAEVDVQRAGRTARDRRGVAPSLPFGRRLGGRWRVPSRWLRRRGRFARRRAGAGVMRPITWPTVTVSPSATSSSVIVPAAGAGSSTSTLSVEISTTVSPASTASPTFTVQSRIVPSVTDSPAAGVTMSIVVGRGGAAVGRRLEPLAAQRRRRAPPMRAAGASLGDDLGEHAPTATVSPSAAWIFTSVSAGRRGNFGVDLVGRDLDDRLVGGHVIALCLAPFEDGAFGRLSRPSAA